MKKVRIMLASVAVLAAVGGTLAWNANKTSFCAYSADNQGLCQFAHPNSLTQADGTAESFVSFRQKESGQCPAPQSANCQNLGIIVAE